jgi:hypothetical protein
VLLLGFAASQPVSLEDHLPRVDHLRQDFIHWLLSTITSLSISFICVIARSTLKTPSWRIMCLASRTLTLFVAEWRAEDVHADVVGDCPQLGHVTGKKAPPLDILER